MIHRERRNELLVAALVLLGAACDSSAPKEVPPAASPSPFAAAAPDPEPIAPEPAPEATPMPKGLAPLAKPWKGDLDGMVKRRFIRVLAVQNPVLYAVDKGRDVGITYEAIKAFEAEINRKLRRGTVKVHVIILPVPRDELLVNPDSEAYLEPCPLFDMYLIMVEHPDLQGVSPGAPR